MYVPIRMNIPTTAYNKLINRYTSNNKSFMLSSTASVLLIQIFLLILYIYIRVMLPPMLLLLMPLLLLLSELFRNVPNVVVIEIGYICFYTVDWC